MKLEMPLSRAMPLSDTILPRASSLRRMGVTSSVAMVPRSFSPAMLLGAMAITPLKSIMIISIGSILLHIMAPMLSSLAWSKR